MAAENVVLLMSIVVAMNTLAEMMAVHLRVPCFRRVVIIVVSSVLCLLRPSHIYRKRSSQEPMSMLVMNESLPIFACNGLQVFLGAYSYLTRPQRNEDVGISRLLGLQREEGIGSPQCYALSRGGQLCQVGSCSMKEGEEEKRRVSTQES
jgi:hypothetical protein